jgi:Nucleotidyltransferase domain
MLPVRHLLERFAADVSSVLSLVALWAHGSYALGDFQPGRSDLDLVAVTDAAITDAQREDLQLPTLSATSTSGDTRPRGRYRTSGGPGADRWRGPTSGLALNGL